MSTNYFDLQEEHDSFRELADKMIEEKDKEMTRLTDENKKLHKSLEFRQLVYVLLSLSHTHACIHNTHMLACCPFLCNLNEFDYIAFLDPDIVVKISRLSKMIVTAQV